jgi:hypothetical protein
LSVADAASNSMVEGSMFCTTTPPGLSRDFTSV